VEYKLKFMTKREQRLKELYEVLNYWRHEFKPSGNFGKWWASLKIESTKKKIESIEKKIKK
jgi:hypothetical protein